MQTESRKASKTAAVVLAAGKGERMKSELPKVLHKLGGKPMIEHVLRALEPLKLDRTLVVVGHQAERVTSVVSRDGIEAVLQAEQRGTGDAVMRAAPALSGFAGTVLVLAGDVPLLPTSTIRDFLAFHGAQGVACTVMTARFSDPKGYGRIVRAANGNVQAIVEHKDATEEELAIREVNTGILAFRASELFGYIDRLTNRNAKGEYYLTDMVGILRQAGFDVAAFMVDDDRFVRGVNSPEQLTELERIFNTQTHAAERH
jgi:bifunctional UDP-N-acetylglucosamine pyrophosphorylase/glucosamine-1-phosphate N-acetyltransferase